MKFLISDTFTASLGKLTSEEQKATKTTAFDLQMNPANPGLRFHKLDRAKDKNFWSVSINMDLRLIVHRSESSLLLCYVNHHDKAYNWAEKRKLTTHPRTGAAQIVEVRESVEEIHIPVYIQDSVKKENRPLQNMAKETLLDYGVPEEWIDDVINGTEDELLVLAERLPGEAAEAILCLATGSTPEEREQPTEPVNPFEHPDAKRRFRLINTNEELQEALDAPWEKWVVFLHPDQRQIVERNYNGPARVSGSAGTGKTIVALHRAVTMAKNDEDSRVLLATFSETLASALQGQLKKLLNFQPRLGERIDVESMDALAKRLYTRLIGPVQIVSAEQLQEFIKDAIEKTEITRFSRSFLRSEWEQVFDAWQIKSWDEYREVPRLGRKNRLSENQRNELWQIFNTVQTYIDEKNLCTVSSMFTQLAEKMSSLSHKPYDYAVIDEAQDISISQLKFLAAMLGKTANGLFFSGDLGQRIFQTPFSWKSLGVDIRGRSRTLKINYRTSHQIREQADLLLASSVSDSDGNRESRKGTISVFNGPAPLINEYDSEEEEIEAVADWISEQIEDGMQPHEIGIIVRSEDEIERAVNAVESTELRYSILDRVLEPTTGEISICTMHKAKGLEFRAVSVMACDDEVIPSQSRIEAIAEDSDLDEVYETERHLLYVACTRARDRLIVTSGNDVSEYVDDLLQS